MRKEKVIIAAFLAWAAFVVSVWFAVGYVAFHFISKHW